MKFNWIVILFYSFVLFAYSSKQIVKTSKEKSKKETITISNRIRNLSLKIKESNIYRDENREDTIFIIKNRSKDYNHTVYIEKNRKSKYYRWLTDFKFDEYDLEGFNNIYEALKEKSAVIKKFKTYDLPKEWLPLYQYKNNYYLYAPCDWGNTGKKIISDSLLISSYIDGPYPYVITSLEKINQNTYKIESKDYFDDIDVIAKPEELYIYMIDKKNKIAVWEYKSKNNGDSFFRLFIAKEKAKKYDIIVNYCDKEKALEFDFDTINFQKLINKK